MRLIIDARYTRTSQHDGISRFTASLIEALSEEHDVRMLISDEAQLPMLPKVPYSKVSSPTSWREPFVAFRVNRLRPDVVFSPMQTMGSWGRKYGLVLTLHDLIYYQYPAPPGFLPAPVRFLWRIFHKAYWPQRVLLNRADVVASVSETTKSLMAEHRLTRRPVRVVYNAATETGAPRDLAEAPTKEILYMGSFMNYKNVETLIAAMAYLPEYTLHLTSGIRADRRAELEALVPDGATVVFHNGIAEEDYQQLLRRVTASVTLSRAEGFGIPLVEAMRAGTPVIASDIPIFREVSGGAAILVDPDDARGFAETVRSLEPAERFVEVSQASVSRASDFSWSSSATVVWDTAQEAFDIASARGRVHGERTW